MRAFFQIRAPDAMNAKLKCFVIRGYRSSAYPIGKKRDIFLRSQLPFKKELLKVWKDFIYTLDLPPSFVPIIIRVSQLLSPLQVL